MTTLLIDADILAYQACSKNEVTIKWEDDIHTLHSDLSQCIHTFESLVDDLVNASGCSQHLLCFSDRTKTNFRKTLVDPTYKANRKDVRKPLALRSLEEYAYKNHQIMMYPSLEADDVIGILATRTPNCTIFSIDKDLNQVPGRHFTGASEFTVTPEQGFRFFMSQVITGDPTDGYKGCPGSGAVAAEKLLTKYTPTDWWLAVVALFDKAGLTEEDALTQARMARILTNELYNPDTGQITLWSPTA